LSIESLQHEVDQIAQFLGVKAPDTNEEIQRLIAVLNLAAASPDLTGIAISDRAWVNQAADLEELLQIGNRLNQIHQEYDAIFIPEAWDQQVLEIRQNLIAHGHKWYKFLIGDYKKSIKQLASFLNTSMPTDLQTKLKYIDAVSE